MNIQKDMVVSVSYQLHEQGFEGPMVEKTTAENPLTFLFGSGSLLADFEDNLAGLATGDNFQFKIEAANGYGLVNPQAVVDLPMDTFVVDGAVASDLLVVGKVIPMQDQHGRRLQGKIVAITDTTVKIDFNHPMAGKDLYFKGQVEQLRAATPSELEHGHAHGPGGHQH